MIVSQKKVKVSSSEQASKIMRAILYSEHEIDRNKEHFWCIGLNTKNVIQYIELVTLGVLNSSLVHPREVFRFAIMKGVSQILIAHNHPSGDPEPSREDKAVTMRLKGAGEVVGIDILDHIIIGDCSSYYSFAEHGWEIKKEEPEEPELPLPF